MANRDGSLRILVLGYIVRGPLAGLVWHHLQYLLGLVALGHDVHYVEDSGDYPSCYDPIQGLTSADPRYGLAFARRLFSRVGLADRWAYFDAHTDRWFGPGASRIAELAATADIVLNLSGITPLRPWIMSVPARIYIDTDPVFTQVKILTDPAARDLARRHTAFFTFGERLGLPGTTPLGDGQPWRPTRQPVVLDRWRVVPPPARPRFTTVFQWQSYTTPIHGGVRYGMKAESFMPYLDLPRRARGTFELALAGSGAPRELLRAHGWRLRDPDRLSRSPWTYQRYIERSSAEWSVAKEGYVTSQCGWFSERTACYLASGRPAIVHDTGYSLVLPTGLGLLPFTSMDEALAAIENVTGNYATHARAARMLAETHFDSATVLTRLLDDAFSGGGAADGALVAASPRQPASTALP